jgi:hypothetical protein
MIKFLILITTFFLLVIKPGFSQFKVLDDLKKAGDQLQKELETPKEKPPAAAQPSAPKPPAAAQPSTPVKAAQAIKQTPFSKSFRMMCTYSGNNRVQQITYAVDGKNFIINGFNIELGVELGGMLAIRQGSSNTVKFVNNQSGIVVNTMVDFDKLKADQQVATLNVTLIGVCQKL